MKHVGAEVLLLTIESDPTRLRHFHKPIQRKSGRFVINMQEEELHHHAEDAENIENVRLLLSNVIKLLFMYRIHSV